MSEGTTAGRSGKLGLDGDGQGDTNGHGGENRAVLVCYRVGMRLDEPEMPSLLVGHHRLGFYMRVVTEGVIEAGDEIVKTACGPHQISVADIDALLYLPDRDLVVEAADAGPAAGSEPGWPGFRPLRVVACPRRARPSR